MKTLCVRNCLFSLAVLAAASIAPAGAYPPDNAAVLYYRAILVYEKPEGAILDNLSAMIKDGAPASEESKRFLAKQRHVVQSVSTAAEIKLCDWGHDYSEGFAMLLPGLADMRNIARIVLADGVKALHDGDSKTAAQRCITTYKMSRHLKTEVLINNLVGIAMESMAQSVAQQILARRVDMAILDLLKRDLAQIELDHVPLEHCMRMEMKWVLDQPREKLLAAGESLWPENVDLNFVDKSVAYYSKKMDDYISALRLPYKKATSQIDKLHGDMEADAKARPEAAMSQAIIPALKKAYSLNTKAHTSRNALRAAIEIYRISARTGRLPDRLPPNLPQDMFSGKAFDYEVTSTGFTLRCQEVNQDSRKIEEYAFALPK